VTQINPLAGSLVQVPQVPRQQTGAKVGPIHPAQAIGKIIPTGDDTFAHQVKNTGEVAAIGDRESARPKQPRKSKSAKPAANTKPAKPARFDLLA